MADRDYSVVVRPDEWGGALEELAEAMKPVARREPGQLLPLLARGPMTLEADLSVDEAEMLKRRLNNLSVPARVVDEAGAVVSASEHEAVEPDSDASESPDKSFRIPEPKGSASPPATPDAAAGSGAVDPPEPQASTPAGDDPPETGDSTEADEAWSGFLDGVGGDFGAEPAERPDDAPQQKKPESDDKSGKKRLQDGGVSGQDGSVAPQQPPQPPSTGPADGKAGQVSSSRSTASSDEGADAFDASRMTEAFEARERARPPHEPDGFDDRIAHVPGLAALLSLLAPGAGQVYNGQRERASHFGMRFLLLRPWYESVRQAYDYAEKIRTYWAPYPDSGAFGRAVRYLLMWWLVVGPLVAGLVWAGGYTYERVRPPEEPEISELDVQLAVDRAQSEVEMAHIGGLDGVSEFVARPGEEHERFTMSDEERAERLFRRGVDFCEQGMYGTCQDAMKRVAELNPELRRYAFRLQAWASVERETGADEPMPEFDAIGSLSEYEEAKEEADSNEEIADEVDGIDSAEDVEEFEEMVDSEAGAADGEGEGETGGPSEAVDEPDAGDEGDGDDEQEDAGRQRAPDEDETDPAGEDEAPEGAGQSSDDDSELRIDSIEQLKEETR